MLEITFVMRLGFRQLFRIEAGVSEARERAGAGGAARLSAGAVFALIGVDTIIAIALLLDAADCSAATCAPSRCSQIPEMPLDDRRSTHSDPF